jgi:hypothetical protein
VKNAKATLSLDQLGSLLEGKSVIIRLPEQRVPMPDQPETIKRIIPGIEVELSRAPIPNGTHVVYEITSNASDASLDMSFINQMFDGFDGMFKAFEKGFDHIFRLPRSK